MGRAEKRASFRNARANLPPEVKRQLKAQSGRRRNFIDRSLHPPEPPEPADDTRPRPVGMVPPPPPTPEEMDRREAEIVATIPEVIRGEPETALMLTRLRSSWMNPVPQAIAEKWWAEWQEFLESRPEARKVHAAQTGLYVPGLSDQGSLSGLIIPGGPS
jgi:hypothetical protein